MYQPPYIEVFGSEGTCWGGWPAIGQVLLQHLKRLGKEKTILTVECYPGTYASIDMGFLKSALSPNVVCRAEDLFLEENDIRQRTGTSFTAAPRADVDLPGTVSSYFDPQKLTALRATIEEIENGIILVHGVGAHLIAEPDILIYSDVSRYELIQRLRRGDITNIAVDNREQSYALQYAWSYFIDWPLGDHIKQSLLPSCDYVLETNNWQRPKMAKGSALRQGLELALRQPLAPSPFFDPELWEGRENTDQPAGDLGVNYHLRIEEDNLLFKIGDQLFETPAVNLLFYDARTFLGPAVRNNYGDRFPYYIQFFDHLKQKLHDINFYPTPSLLAKNFGKTARHKDYYYVVKARKNAVLLAGLLPEAIALSAEHGQPEKSPTEKDWRARLRAYPLATRDLVAIPSGVIHSTGTGCQLLNIGIATPLFRQHLINKKAGKRPHLSLLNTNGLQNLLQQGELGSNPVVYNALPTNDGPIRLTQLSEASHEELPDTKRVRAICVVEGQSAQLHYDSIDKPYHLQPGQVVVLPAGLEKVAWSAEAGTRAVLIDVPL